MRYIVYILTFFFIGNSFAQEKVNFSLVASKNKVLLGESVKVNLLFQYSAEIDESSIGFPVISDSTDFGENVEISSIDSSQQRSSLDNLNDAQMYFEQGFTITSFDSGMVEIGPITAYVGDELIQSNVVSILFQPIAVDTTLDFKDIKSIVDDPLTTWEKIKIWLGGNWPWLATVIAAILATILFILWRKRKPEKVEIVPQTPLPIRLLEMLDNIEKEELWQNNKNKLYYTKLTDVLREYIEDRYSAATFEKTSNEILANLKLKSISDDHYILISKLLKLSDMVKFAKTLPTGGENEEAIVIVRNLIQETRTDLTTDNKETKDQN